MTADNRAGDALNRAGEASQKADQANAKAESVGRDLGDLRNTVANLDDYNSVKKSLPKKATTARPTPKTAVSK
jgi:hypothetical protein